MIQEEEKKRAVDYFHAAPSNWNCAQAVFKSHPEEVNLSDEEIELSYRSKGGGRAEGGLCGAVYAAIEILGKDSEKALALEKEFQEELGGLTCRQLKAEFRIPCKRTVEVADQLLDKYLKE